MQEFLNGQGFKPCSQCLPGRVHVVKELDALVPALETQLPRGRAVSQVILSLDNPG